MATVRITTWNVNGLRAAARKGLIEQIDRLRPDVLLLQEVRALPEQVDPDVLDALSARFAHVVWNPASRLGFSGTATLSRRPLDAVRFGLAGSKRAEADEEGRLIESRLTVGGTKLRVLNLYMPSGSSGDHRQAVKDAWLESFEPITKRLGRSPIATLIAGDINIAHDDRDIFHAASNRKSSGFLPHERAWFGAMLAKGFSDTLRESAGDVDGPYTWWSQRGRAAALDRGWRIDHVFANRTAAGLVRTVGVDREAGLACSDHAPVSVVLRAG